MTDRKHQAELCARLQEVEGHGKLTILAYVVPGGGKSRLPGIVLERFRGLNVGWFVPRLSLRRQAALDLKRVFNIDVRESGNETNPSKGTRGFVATHQALCENPGLWGSEFKLRPYLLVVDEMHHAKEARSGERNELHSALDRLADRARVVLNMTGTLDTNDSSYIRGIDYVGTEDGDRAEPESSSDIYVRYTRAEALSEGALVPIEFHHGDGPVRFNDGEEKAYESLRDVKSEDEAKALFTVLNTEHATHLLTAGVDHFKRHGRRLLVVCDRQERAKKYARVLSGMGIEPALAIVETDDALGEIERFKGGGARALVTCAMAYEGLDVPDITHVICLTHIRSVPWIEQMFGRAWRAAPAKTKCWAFVPDDKRMNRTIARIHAEQVSTISPLRESDGHRPGEPGQVVAIESRVESLRAAMLDGTAALSDIEERVLAALAELGIGPDHPAFDMVVKAADEIATARSRGNVSTVLDEETRFRNGIARSCRENDFRRGVTYGTTQRELFRKTGKSITAMTLPELRNAASIVARLCA